MRLPLLQPPSGYGPPMTFTRASAAYLDGVLYPSGVARRKRIAGLPAVLIEEGTTNLLSTAQADLLATGSAVSLTVTSGTKYTVSISGTGSITLSGAGSGTVTNGSPVTITASTTTLTLTPATTATYVQAEAKAYKTSWITGGTTRAAESLTIPVNAVDLGGGVIDYTNALINPTAGTVEFDYTPTNDDKSADKFIFGFGNATNFIRMYSAQTTGNYAVWHKYNSGTSRYIYSTIAVVAGVPKKHKVKFTGNVLDYWIDGVKIGTTTFDGLPSLFGMLVYLGADYSGFGYRNGYISNVRISNIARSDAEMAYTGRLRRDQYTTFLGLVG